MQIGNHSFPELQTDRIIFDGCGPGFYVAGLACMAVWQRDAACEQHALGLALCLCEREAGARSKGLPRLRGAKFSFTASATRGGAVWCHCLSAFYGRRALAPLRYEGLSLCSWLDLAPDTPWESVWSSASRGMTRRGGMRAGVWMGPPIKGSMISFYIVQDSPTIKQVRKKQLSF